MSFGGPGNRTGHDVTADAWAPASVAVSLAGRPRPAASAGAGAAPEPHRPDRAAAHADAGAESHRPDRPAAHARTSTDAGAGPHRPASPGDRSALTAPRPSPAAASRGGPKPLQGGPRVRSALGHRLPPFDFVK
jgi:hypothetical protein